MVYANQLRPEFAMYTCPGTSDWVVHTSEDVEPELERNAASGQPLRAKLRNEARSIAEFSEVLRAMVKPLGGNKKCACFLPTTPL